MPKFIWFIFILAGVALIIMAVLPPPGQEPSLFKAGLGLGLMVVSYLKFEKRL